MPSFRTMGLVALFDLYESLRTRRAIALLLLYLVTALGASAAFIRTIDFLRAQMGADNAALAGSLVHNEQFIQQVGQWLGDLTLARALVQMPPLALFYGLLALNCLPLLVILTSSDTIAAERASGAARFTLFRADRLSWALGKLIGQVLLMVVGVALGAAGSFTLGYLFLEDFAPAATGWWMVRFSGRASCYGFAYLGLAFCASQLARTGARARWLGLALLFGVWLAGQLLQVKSLFGRFEPLSAALQQLLPSAYHLALWQPSFGARLPAMGALVLLGFGFFALGYLRFGTQDA